MPSLGCPATAVSFCILCPLQDEKEADKQRKKDKEATRLAAAAGEGEAREAKEAAEKATGVFYPCNCLPNFIRVWHCMQPGFNLGHRTLVHLVPHL